MIRKIPLDENEYDLVYSILRQRMMALVNMAKPLSHSALKSVLELEAGILSDVLEEMRNA